MKLHVILLLIWSLCRHRVASSLPDLTPAPPLLQVEASVNSESKVVSVLMKNEVSRLPGLCRRLKRRRISVLCNLEKFCWWGRSQGRGQVGQVCRCPRGSRCSHFFVHSL